MNETFDVKAFATEQDNVLIAPAGFGKTHTISECLKHTEGKQLILTHTQAGVASIKDKLQKCLIGKEKYSVETISSFAQRYVYSFYNSAIPDETDENFYSFFLEKATEILSLKLVQDIVKISYTGLYVDEYQDCIIEQHNLVLVLADILPTHVLGDPLQGIFGFKKGDVLIDLEDPLQMGRFSTTYELEIPHRWINGGNPKLGKELLDIRNNLKTNTEIDLTKYTSIEFKQGVYGKHYKTIIDILINDGSVLVIHPDTMKTTVRENFIVAFKDIPILIEAFDGKDFYASAKAFDNSAGYSPIIVLHNFIIKYFSNLDTWYDKTNKKFKKKREASDEAMLVDIKKLICDLQLGYSLPVLRDLIFKIKGLRGVNCARRDLLNSLNVSMENAHDSGINVLEAMRKHRNSIRRVGRKMYGKYVGTTLLTKGLEFDTVIILEAEKFKNPKHFYVALSRCSKRLIILSEVGKLNPYPAVVSNVR